MSQPLKLRSVFYSLAESLSIFSAKLNAFESILLVSIFLRYYYVATVAFTSASKGFDPNHRLQDTDEFKAVGSSFLLKEVFSYAPDKKTLRFFHVKIVTQASEQNCYFSHFHVTEASFPQSSYYY